MGLAAWRMRAHLPLFFALFGVVGVITGFAGGIAGYVTTASVAGVREGYAAATGSDGSLRIDIREGDTGQDAAVRAAIADQFDGVPLLVERTLESDSLTVGTPDGDAQLALAAVDVQPRATLVEGTWPGAGEAVAGAGTGLETGDTLTLPGGVEVTVSGVWSATDPLDPYWFGEDVSHLVVIDETEFAPTGVVPLARWSLQPDPASISPDQLDTVSSGALGLLAALDADDAVGTGNVVVSGGLAAWTDRLRGSLGAVAGVAPVPIILAGIIGLVTLVELARLLVGVRVVETSLLRSRGASAGRLTRDAAAEAALAAVPGALVGAAVAGLLAGSWTWAVPALVAVGAVVTFALTAFLDARAPARRETAQNSGRGRRAAGVGLLVLVIAAAALSAWQFLLYGSPVVRGADGRSVVDPIAVLAPALVLVACALLAVALFGVVSGAFERATRRRGRISWTLAARQVARRAAVFTTPVLLISLAVGGVTVAAAYSATWERATQTALEVGNGAIVRAVTTDPVSSFVTIPGVDAAAAVLAAPLQLGDDPVALVSLPAGSVETVVTPAGGSIDPRRLAEGIAVDTPTLEVPAGTRELVVDATAPTLLWLMDGAGQLATLRPGTTALPEGDGWRILAADVVVDAAQSPYSYRIEGITADGVQLPLGDWALAPDALPLEGKAAREGVGFVATLDIPRAGSVRIVPAGDLELPLVISQSLADRGSAAVGDELTLRFVGSGREVVGTVADIIPAVPGTSNGLGVVADLPGLLHEQLLSYATVPAPGEVWISTSDPSAITGTRVTTTVPSDSLLAAGRGALWIGGIGGLVLAVAAVSAIAGALLRGRSGELVVLRVVGLTARQQADSRRREMLVVILYSTLAGLLAGAAASVLLVPGLARSAVLDPPAALATALRVDVVWGGAAIVGLLAALLVVVLLYAARVQRQARVLSVREEVR